MRQKKSFTQNKKREVVNDRMDSSNSNDNADNRSVARKINKKGEQMDRTKYNIHQKFWWRIFGGMPVNKVMPWVFTFIAISLIWCAVLTIIIIK